MYGTSPTEIASGVSNWTSLGVKLPTSLTKALDTLDALRWVEIEHQPVFDVDRVTAANAEQMIRDYAAELAPVLPLAGNGGSPLARAKAKAVDLAARTVVGEAAKAVQPIIAKLAPEFDRHAAAYIGAARQLPGDLDADTLIAAGPDAVAAFGVAQTEAGYLRSIAAWVCSTVTLPGHQAEPDPVLRGILQPTNVDQLSGLGYTQRLNANATTDAVDKILLAAARAGVPFGIGTLRDAAALRQSLVVPAAKQPA